MPKAFSEQDKEWIRCRLLEAGEKLFTQHGLKKTNIEELAAAVGISKGAFYLFYPSKESLFMDVVEQAEVRFRQQVLAVVDKTGPSPRARLTAVFNRAFSTWREIPLLHFFTRADYDLLSRRIDPEQIQAHLRSDQEFIQTLIARCRAAGIPFQAPPEQVGGLLLAVFLTILHEDDFGPGSFQPTQAVMLELVAAFCLGEIILEPPISPHLGSAAYPGETP